MIGCSTGQNVVLFSVPDFDFGMGRNFYFELRMNSTTAIRASKALLVSAVGIAGGAYLLDSRAAFHRYISMPLIRATMDPEESHNFTIRLASAGLIPRDFSSDDPCLQTKVLLLN